jgi:hypothetical protein
MKKWTEKQIVIKLKEDSSLVERAMVVLWQQQTVAEQKSDTVINRNDIGFSAADASKGSYYAKWVLGLCTRDGLPGRLTRHHLDRARQIAIKYRRQLTELTNSGRARQLFRDAEAEANRVLAKKRMAHGQQPVFQRMISPMRRRNPGAGPYCGPADANARNDRWKVRMQWEADRGSADAADVLAQQLRYEEKQAHAIAEREEGARAFLAKMERDIALAEGQAG